MLNETKNWVENEKLKQFLHVGSDDEEVLESKLNTLNPEQRLFYDLIVSSDKANKQELIMLIGAAGFGKSHALNEAICYLKHRVAVCAFTASAAFNVNGVTIYGLMGSHPKATYGV